MLEWSQGNTAPRGSEEHSTAPLPFLPAGAVWVGGCKTTRQADPINNNRCHHWHFPKSCVLRERVRISIFGFPSVLNIYMAGYTTTVWWNRDKVQISPHTFTSPRTFPRAEISFSYVRMTRMLWKQRRLLLKGSPCVWKRSPLIVGLRRISGEGPRGSLRSWEHWSLLHAAAVSYCGFGHLRACCAR